MTRYHSWWKYLAYFFTHYRPTGHLWQFKWGQSLFWKILKITFLASQLSIENRCVQSQRLHLVTKDWDVEYHIKQCRNVVYPLYCVCRWALVWRKRVHVQQHQIKSQTNRFDGCYDVFGWCWNCGTYLNECFINSEYGVNLK